MTITWTCATQPVPGHDEWVFRIGLGGPCWCMWLKRDGYTSAQIGIHGEVTSRNVPVDVLRWLLDNCPPLDSWVRPTEEQVKAAWALEDAR